MCIRDRIRIGDRHGLRDGNAEGGDALAVPFGFGILKVQGAAESFESVVVGLLEFGVLCGELRGALFDQLLEVALVGTVFEHQTAVLQGSPNAQE